jgi:hypothetical protein
MKILVAVCALMATLTVSAQKRVVSVDALDNSYTGGLVFKSDKAKGPNRSESDFRFNLNYAQNLEELPGFMWKAKVFVNRSSVEMGQTDALDSSVGAAGGLLYNFQPEDIRNSFMFGALLGVERSSVEFQGLKERSGFNTFVEFEGGKRWDLGKYAAANISYAPTIAFTWKRYGGDIRKDYFKSGHEVRFNFLKFDILF